MRPWWSSHGWQATVPYVHDEIHHLSADANTEAYALTKNPKLNVLLRPSRSTDASALTSILYDTFESTWLPNITPAAAKAYRDEDRPTAYVARRGMLFWVAECNRDVVGFIDWEGDFINALHVRDSHARRGIGQQLLDHAEAGIANAGFPAVRLETDIFNIRSRSSYTARGYREADRYPDTEWNSDLTTLLFVKTLTRQ